AGGELVSIPSIGYGNFRQPLPTWQVRTTLNSADLITYPSEPVRLLLEQHSPESLHRACKLALGVDTQLFSPSLRESVTETEPAANVTRFVTVGSLVPVKNHAMLVEASARLRKLAPDTAFELQLAGDGPLL